MAEGLRDIDKRSQYLEKQVFVGRILVSGLSAVVLMLLAEFIRGLFP